MYLPRKHQSKNRPPLLDRYNYEYLKAMMRDFIVSVDIKAGIIISGGWEFPTGDHKKQNL